MQEHQSSQHSFIKVERNFSNTSQTQVNQASPNQVTLPSTIGVGGMLSLIMGGMALIFMVSKLRKSKQEPIKVVNLQQLNEIPCSNCRFFSSNPYLKCAVHPAIALTKQAIDCADYCPQAKKLH